MTQYACQLDAIQSAADRIRDFVHETPVLTCTTIDRLAGRSLVFKCENFQRGGSFKIRGACNAVMQLSDEAGARGVVTHSSGNFAQALAIAARMRGIAAHIVMPETAPAVKRRAVEGYGATVYPCPPTLAAREAGAAEIIERFGATMIHPFDHPHVIAGQGTIGLELIAQAGELRDPAGGTGAGTEARRHGAVGEAGDAAPHRLETDATHDRLETGATREAPAARGGVDAVVVPIGGGGLISGIALALRGAAPHVRVIAAEPAGADDAARSKASGRLIPQTGPKTIADGLLTSLGTHTWPVVRDLVDRVMTVTDDQIIAAMRLIWERMKIVVEPSAAVPLAVALSDGFQSLSGINRAALVLSGGNVDLDRWPW